MSTISIPVVERKKTAGGPKKRTDKLLYGYVLLSEETARLLSYQSGGATSTTTAKITDKKGYARVGKNGEGSIDVAESRILNGVSGTRRQGGGKRVVLYTNKPTRADGKTMKQASINVPQWMSALDISCFIAQRFPNVKYGYDASEIRPFFRVEKGKAYPIITKQEADKLKGDGVDSGPDINLQKTSEAEYMDAQAGN